MYRLKLSRNRALALIIVFLAATVAGVPGAGAWADGSGGGGGPGDFTTHGAAHFSESSRYTVTLITGDRVHIYMDGGNEPLVAVEGRQGAGAHVSYEVSRQGADVYVYPEDVFPLLGTKLDRELFNVTALVEYGYDDDSMGGTPAVVTFTGGGSGADGTSVTSSSGLNSLGMNTIYEFKAIPAASVFVPMEKAGAGAWPDILGGEGSADLLGSGFGVEKVWLDAPVHAALQDSVPHVGAPSAWESGFDGTGVRVAVLDTGIDKDHLDLQGRIVQEADFTGSGDPSDGHGHGTHVASTVAGTGEASGGLRKGVAPGADIINGKVLTSSGRGQGSWTMAAMEWAVSAAGAQVVNMSLGNSQASDGTDPMSQLLNSLTEQYGVLFIVAAGNEGAFQSVGIPAVADSALAVANFSKTDELAPLSSRGPRYHDWAIKPEIAAPGQFITAARAEGTALGPVVDDFYTTISGTSMATPHVAGAAAIIIQKHGEMDPDQLKSLLMGTSKTIDGYTVYEQGAGRLDVVRALEQGIYTTVPAVNFGVFPLPYDEHDPVAAAFGYRNDRDEAVTLSLAVNVKDGAGNPVTGLLELADETVTVGAGETVETSVTLTPAHGETSLYSGYITAASADGDVELVVPVGFYLEPDRFDLSVGLTLPDGQPATGTHRLAVFQVAGELGQRDKVVARELSFTDGWAEIRLDPGVYHVSGLVTSTTEWTYVSYPEVSLYDGDESITVNMTERVPVDVTVETHDVERDIWASFGGWRVAVEGGEAFIFSQEGHIKRQQRVFTVPTAPVTRGEFYFWSRWRYSSDVLEGMTESEASASVHDNEPLTFDLFYEEKGSIPTSMNYRVTEDNLADLITVENNFHHNVDPVRIQETRHRMIGSFGSPATGVYFVETPGVRTDFLSPGGGWSGRALYDISPGVGSGTIREPFQSHDPGEHVTHSWFKQPVRPTLVEATHIQADGTMVVNDLPGRRRRPARMANRLGIYVADMTDSVRYHSSGSWEFSDVESTMRLYRGDELIGEGLGYNALYNVDPEEAVYTAVIEVDLSGREEAPWAGLSTQTYTAWTFESGFVDGEELIPFLLADYDIDLDLLNTGARPGSGGPGDEIGLHLHYPAWHDETAIIEEVSFWVSGDDGETWLPAAVTPAPGEGRYIASTAGLNFDPAAEFVSIKLEARAAGGESIVQEVIRTYRIADGGGVLLTVTEPEEGTYTNDDTITVAGSASDAGGGPVAVEINGEKAAVGADGSFEQRILLPETDGPFEITVVVANEHGDTAEETRTVIVDRTAPVISEVLPHEDVELEWGEELTVRFTSEPSLDASYQMLVSTSSGDLPGIAMEEVSAGVYEATYTAPHGAAFNGAEIEVYAKDSAGNITRVTAPGKVTVIPDDAGAPAPTVVITEPTDGFLTNRDAVRVSGTASAADGIAKVTVNGREVAIGADGVFTTRIILWEGDNSVTVTATATGGAEATELITVAADWTAPSLAGMEPAFGVTLAWGESYTFRFESEPGLTAAYQVIVGGSRGTLITRDIPVKGTAMTEVEPGIYEAVYAAPSGVLLENAIVQFSAADGAGNVIITTAPGSVTVVE